MNIEEDLTCKCCNEIFKNPITLNCCGDNICKKHIEQLITNSTTNQFACPLCNEHNYSHKLKVNNFIQKLIEKNMHQLKIDCKYEETLNSLNAEVEKFEAILKNPEQVILEEMSELKRLVALDRERLKSEIERRANELIQRLESYEAELKEDYKKKIDYRAFGRLVETAKIQSADYERCLNKFVVEGGDEQRKACETFIEKLQSEIKQIKAVLFSNLSFSYEPKENNAQDLLGQLLVAKVSKIFISSLF